MHIKRAGRSDFRTPVESIATPETGDAGATRETAATRSEFDSRRFRRYAHPHENRYEFRGASLVLAGCGNVGGGLSAR